MGVYQRSDSPYYWLLLERPNRPAVRRATRTRIKANTPAQTKENKRLAEVEYHKAMAELAKERLDLPREVFAPTYATFLDRYKKYLTFAKKDTEETIRRLEKFRAVFKETPLDEIRPAQIHAWRATRKGVSDQTIVRDVNALRGLLTRAVEWDVLPESPLKGLRLDAEPGETITRYLTPEEEQRLMEALTARDTAHRLARERLNAHRKARRRKLLPPLPYFADWLTPMVLISLHTGIRQGELFQLTWNSINTHAKTLTIRAKTAKSEKIRHLPMNDRVLTAVKHWQEQSGLTEGLVFPSKTTQERLTNVQTSWDHVRKDARLTDFRWHDLRHTFASKLAQHGVSLYEIMRLMGHASILTTQRYAHLAPDMGRAAVDGLA